MNSLVVVAVPPVSQRPFAKALLVLFAIVERKIMLSGDIKHLPSLCALDHLNRCVEFGRLRTLGDIAGMNHELWLLHPRPSCIDLVDGDLQGAGHILVGCFIEADMTVADLHEREVLYHLLLP